MSSADRCRSLRSAARRARSCRPRLTLDRDGLMQLARCDGVVPQLGDRRADPVGRRVVDLDHHERGDAAAREGVLHLGRTPSSPGSTSGTSPARCTVCICSAGCGEREQRAAGDDGATSGCRSTGSSTAFQKRLSPSSRRMRRANGMRTLSTRSPSFESSAGRTVSEPSDGDADDDHRRRRRSTRTSVAGEEHAGHGDHHGQAGDEHRTSGGRGGGLERCALAASLRRSSRSRFK